MFIKYVLVPKLGEDAKISRVILHPRKPVMALEVFGSQHEVVLVEYSFQNQEAPMASSTANREITEESMKMSLERTDSLPYRPSEYAEAYPSLSAPVFEVKEPMHVEKSGLIVDMKWSVNGDYLFLVKNKSIIMYEFHLSQTPALKVKHIVDDKYAQMIVGLRSSLFAWVRKTESLLMEL